MGTGKRSSQRQRDCVYRASIETLEGRTLLSTYTVTNTNDSGAGSLRQAILDANNHSGGDAIAFAIGNGAKTIAPASRLPGLNDNTNLDATTQPGYAGKPLITLDGSHAGSVDGLKIIGSGVTIRGLAITHFNGSGIFIYGKGHSTVAGCYIGVNADGESAGGNSAHGIIIQAPDNTIGGESVADRNVIGANGVAGVFVYTSAATHNTIEGNYIGADASGTSKIGNGRNGVQIDGAPSNLVRSNVIGGNTHDGVLIVNSGAAFNVLQFNRIGTNANGTGRLGNGWYGVEISQHNNIVGGRGAGNVISSNGYGGVVMYLSTSYGNTIQGNYIGTDAKGTKDLGNIGRGVEFTNGAHDNLVGGPKRGQGNVISGNDAGGVGIYSHSTGNYLQRNFIGTTADGMSPLPNGDKGAGIMVTDVAGSNVIGTPKAGNVISGNYQGIVLTGGVGSTYIWGNKIGTDTTGMHDLGNASDGLFIASGHNQIGGTKNGRGNIVSGNGGVGIRLVGSSNNLIRLNIVGADATGAGAIPNAGNGIDLGSGSSNTPVRNNTVAYNGGNGVQVGSTSLNNSIVLNSIHHNGGSGIELAGSSPAQSAPTITSAKAGAVTGSVTGKANTSIYVELYACASGDGEGCTFIGATSVKTNTSGKANFSISLGAGVVANGIYVTATATSASGATSEFSSKSLVA